MRRAMAVWLIIQLSAILGAVAHHGGGHQSWPLTDFEDELQEAAYEVLRQEDWQSYEFPDFKMPSDFMHSFIPGTGVGNREDLVIDVIRNIPVYYDLSFSKWRYERFNNLDYVMGVHKEHVALWRTSVTDKKPFQFASTDLIFDYSPESGSVVLDSILFSRSVNHLQILYVAVLKTSNKDDLINIYEIVDSKGMLVTVIDLGFKTTLESSGRGNKLAYVRSQHKSSLVVLVDMEGENKIIYQSRGSSLLTHYIEVHCQSPVDLLTFSINGHGYIAVANRTIAEVFKMDDYLQDHIPFEWFPYTENILDLEYFRLGFHHYLAIAAERYQALFIWKSGGFFTKQEFYLPDAQQWYSALLPTCRDDIILFLIRKQSAEVFVWNGQTENFALVPHVAPIGFNPLPGSITSFSYNTTAFLLFAQDEDTTQMFSIETHLKSVPDPVLIAGEEVSDVMKHLQSMLDEQEEQISHISTILAKAVKYRGNQTFTGHQTFKTLQTSHQLASKLITIYDDVNWNNSPLTLKEFNEGTEELEAKVFSLENRVNSIEKLVQDVVLLDENAVITGPKIIENAYGNYLKVSTLHIESVSGTNIRRLQNEIYRLDRPQIINGLVNFPELTVEGDMDVKLTVNGVDFGEELMTTDSDQVSGAVMTFDGKLNILGNLDLSGTVNGIDISSDVVTLHGHHVISGIKSFPDGIVAENVETKLLDGLDVVDLERRALTQSGDQVITGSMTFRGGFHTSEAKLFGLLNGYNITELSEKLVRIDEPTEIGGSKFFRHVVVKGNLTVKGLLDNVSVPHDLLNPDKMQVITGKKNFIGEVRASDLTVMGTVDNLNLPADIISLTGNEAIDITLYFINGITVQNDITVEGLLDGVDIKSLTKILNHQDTSTLGNLIFLGPLTILEDMDVKGSINEVFLEEMVKDLVFKDDEQVVFTAPKTYHSVTAESVRVKNKVNGYNLPQDFMLADGNQTIRGTKVFKDHVKLHDVTTGDGKISGVNMVELYQNRITLSDHLGIPKFDDLVINERFIIHGSINGLKFPDDLVLNSADQEISNKIFDGDLHFDSLIIDGDMTVSDKFSGVSLPDFFDQTITLSGKEQIQGDIVLGNTTAFSVEVSGSVNGLDIVEFAENIMSVSKDQNITAFKEFSGNVVVLGNVSSQGINGINLADVQQRAFKLHDTNAVTAPFTFEDLLTVENLYVEGNINGVNFDELVSDSVRTNSTVQLITGETIFLQGFHVNGSIKAEVNGLNILTDVLLKHTPQEVTGKFTFGSLAVGRNIEIDGLVNGIDLSEVNALLAKKNQHNIITSDLVFKKPVNVLANLDVAGLINGKDSNEIKSTAILEMGDQYITGQKFLKGSVTVYGDISSTLINGVNWIDFLKDVVRIDIPQNIPASKTFTSDLEVNGDIFVSGKASVGLINGVDLGKIMNEAVFIDKSANITGDKVFTSPGEITGELMADLINGLNLRRDVITLQCVDEGIQYITGSKEFQNLTVMGNVIVKQYVNGHKLKDLFLDTLTTSGNQTIRGHKLFKDILTAEGNIHSNTVNGLNIKDLITLHRNELIEASMTFTDYLHIKGNLEVTGPLNGIDLEVLSNILYTDTMQTVTGSYSVHKAIAKSDVSIESTINGLDLLKFSGSVAQFYEDTVTRRDALMEISERQCRAVKYLHSVAEASYYALDGFITHQILNYSADFIEATPATKDLILIQTIDEGSSVTAFNHRYDSSQDQFVLTKEFLVKIVKRKVYQVGEQQLIINIGAQSKDSFVSYRSLETSGLKGFVDGAAAILNNQVYLALLYSTTGYCETFTIRNVSSGYPTVSSTGSIFVGKEANALTAFQAWGEVYVAFSRKFDLPLFKQSSLVYLWQDGWKLAQEIPAPASSNVVHFEYLNLHYLVFTNSVPVHETLHPMYIQVYRCTGEKIQPFKLYQKISFDNALGLEVFEFGNLPDFYLTIFNDTRVQVYRLDGEAGFVSRFTLHGKCIIAIETVLVERKLFLVVSQHDKNYVQPSVSVIYKGVTQGSTVPRKEFEYCP